MGSAATTDKQAGQATRRDFLLGVSSQTYDPVYGTTLNAYDGKSTAGRSSGGAALALNMLPGLEVLRISKIHLYLPDDCVISELP